MTLDSVFGIVSRLRELEMELNHVFYERESVIRSAVLALLMNEHVYQIGQPGTGKSLLIRSIGGRISGGMFFETLLNGETDRDIFKGSFGGGLADAHIVFLDEVFRAPKPVLFSLLPVLNERIFYDGGPRRLPLLSLFAASNQNPSPADGLDAFYDRFTFRSLVRSIENKDVFQKYMEDRAMETALRPDPVLTVDKLRSSGEAVRKGIEFDASGRDAIWHLRERFSQEGLWLSDRRWKKVWNAAKGSAAYGFSERVRDIHVRDLFPVLWTYPTEFRTIERILLEIS
jgi:MoxR-like ATPase